MPSFQQNFNQNFNPNFNGSVNVTPIVRGNPTPTNLETSSNTSSLTTHVTGSISPTANRLVTMWVMPTVATAAVPIITGCGLTWVNVATVSSGNRRLSLFRAMGASPTPGAVSIDWNGVSVASCVWSIVEWAGVDTSGTDGSGAIVQFDTSLDAGGAATTLNMTLPGALEHANNVHACGIGLSTQATVTPDADFATIAQDNEAGNAATIETEWAVNQLTCDPTFAAAIAYGISVEIKAS